MPYGFVCTLNHFDTDLTPEEFMEILPTTGVSFISYLQSIIMNYFLYYLKIFISNGGNNGKLL